MTDENSTNVETWDELLHLGISLEKLAEYFQTIDLIQFTQDIDNKALPLLLENHEHHMSSTPERVRSIYLF